MSFVIGYHQWRVVPWKLKGDRLFCRSLLRLAELNSEVSSCWTYWWHDYGSDERTHSAKSACFVLARAVSEFPSAAAGILPGAFLTWHAWVILKESIKHVKSCSSCLRVCHILSLWSVCFVACKSRFAVETPTPSLLPVAGDRPRSRFQAYRNVQKNWNEKSKPKIKHFPLWSEYNSFCDASNWCFSVTAVLRNLFKS